MVLGKEHGKPTYPGNSHSNGIKGLVFLLLFPVADEGFVSVLGNKVGGYLRTEKLV